MATKIKDDSKVKVSYQQEIITLEQTFENGLDFSEIPVFKIENCEILNSSLSAHTPAFGHNVQIMLPANTDFIATDKSLRAQYLTVMQRDDDSLEFIKGSIKSFSNKDLLANKIDAKNVGRHYLDIKVSQSYMFDRKLGEDGKEIDERINSKEESTSGNVIIKYFRKIDQFSGKGINPEVFKYVNGEKTTSFVSPKTKQETPLYLNRGDIVNIEIRPYGVKNQTNDEITLKYNLLTIEIVQTAWDRGLGRTAGSNNKRVHVAPEAINVNALSDIFKGFGQVQTVAKNTTTTVEPTPTVQQVVNNPTSVPTPTVSITPEPTVAVQPVQPTQTAKTVEVVQEVVQPQPQAQPTAQVQTPQPEVNTTPVIDFSALASLDVSSINLGE